ncbi:hypothetical protein AWENTII_002312 [Aspergillus wentii]|nr:hypothetical protein MW887_008092 [Aspergillus wentii]
MEEAYQRMMLGGQPTSTRLLLLFTIFAGAALAWTPELLEKLRSTKDEAKAAFTAYTSLAMSILDDDSQPVTASTVALAAISNLAYLITNSDGFAVKASVLRIRCLLMARTMQIHRLDTVKSQEERRMKGCNIIEIEVQRRVWWHMVATDWLSGFSGGPQEGSYSLQPKHMNVNYPSNVDDEFITEAAVEYNHPLSTPTTMSSFIYRIKMAEICREIVDAMPSILLESQEPEYDLILQLDDKYRTFFKGLPTFFQDDEASISQSKSIYERYPHLPLQRITIHFSVHTRICRLHRPYHLEGTTNPKYAYSHQMCIRSAQKVLELRRAMDDASAKVGIKPTRFWVVTQHVFLAALILATDVSFNPDAVDAEARKEKVLSAYRILERSKEESSVLMEGIQRNMQTLMMTLQKQRAQIDLQSGEPAAGEMASNDDSELLSAMNRPSDAFIDTDLGDWDNMWSEFLAVAPELDAPQWNSLLDDMDFNLPDVQ